MVDCIEIFRNITLEDKTIFRVVLRRFSCKLFEAVYC